MADDYTIRPADSDRIHVREVNKDVQVREIRPGELRELEVRRSEAELLTEREAARARLKASVDVLAERANLQVQMQKEPLKMIGGASAVGAVLGMVVGRQFRRSKKIYVDAASPIKHQKALMKAQKKQGGQSVGGALVAAAVPLIVRMVTEKFVTPKLEELSSGLLDRAAGSGAARPVKAAPSGGTVYLTPAAQGVAAPRPVYETATPAAPASASVRPADAFLKREGHVARADAPEAQTASTLTAVPDPKAEAPKLAPPVTPSASLATGQGGSVLTLGQAVSALFTTPTALGQMQGQAAPAGAAKPSAVNPTHPGVVRMPESRVEAKAVGTPLTAAERANPTPARSAAATTTGPTGPVVTPVHPGVVRMPESQVDAKAQGTPLAAAERGNPNAQAPALTSAAAGGTGPTGPVVSPTHPGVVRMPGSQVDAKAVGTPLTDTERGNPNAR